MFFSDRTQSYHCYCLMTSSLTEYSLLNDCFMNVSHWLYHCGICASIMIKTFRYHVYLNVWVYLLTIEPLTNDIQNSFITASYGILLYTVLLKTNGFYF